MKHDEKRASHYLLLVYKFKDNHVYVVMHALFGYFVLMSCYALITSV